MTKGSKFKIKGMMENETFPNMVINLLGRLISLADKMDLPRSQMKSSNKQEKNCYFSLAYD